MNAAIINDINYCKYVKPAQLCVTTTVAAGPTKLTGLGGGQGGGTPFYFRKATVLGKNTIAGANNTGVVQLGASATPANQPYSIASNGETTLACQDGAKFYSEDWFFTVANDNDGLVLIYS